LTQGPNIAKSLTIGKKASGPRWMGEKLRSHGHEAGRLPNGRGRARQARRFQGFDGKEGKCAKKIDGEGEETEA